MNINFQGIPTAKVKTPFNTINLYNINSEDYGLVHKIKKNLNLKELMPGLKENEYNIWDSIIHSAFVDNFYRNSQAIIAACENKPCGVMNFDKNRASFSLNYIGTWPITKGQKVPFAGKSLFMELFKKFLDSKALFIELNALRYGPFDPVGKYLKLGFKPYGGDNYQEIMRMNRETAQKSFQRLEQDIKFETIDSSQNVNLTKELYV